MGASQLTKRPVAVEPEIRQAQVAAVLERIESGESENAACNAVGINRLTFRYSALKAGAVNEYARACVALAHQQVESIDKSIEEMREGVIDAAQARVEIEARKWLASKFLPKQYGDRVQLAGDKESPLNPNPGLDVSLLTTEERQALRLLLNATVERMRERDERAIEDKT